MKTRFSAALFCAAFLFLTSSCNRQQSKPEDATPDKYVEVPGAVGFDIEPLAIDKEGASSWLAKYHAGGKTAIFRIEFGKERVVRPKELSDLSLTVGEGKFIAEPGSDASILLRDLQKALEATKLPIKVKRAQTLPFTFVSLGGGCSQDSAGGFNTDPPGNWMPYKIFLGEGEQEGDVFLNINPAIPKGQLSIKDSEYGDVVLSHLAKVL